jgi:hypothetical protein
MVLHKFGVQTLESPSFDNILALCEESGLGYAKTGRKAANHNDVYDKKLEKLYVRFYLTFHGRAKAVW